MKKEKKKAKILSILLVLCLLGICVTGSNDEIAQKHIEEEETPMATSVTPVALKTLLEDSASINSLESCDFGWDQWISGEYHYSSGLYRTSPSRICLSEYKMIRSKEYKISLSNPYYIICITQFDKNGDMLGYTYCVNKMKYTPKSAVKYVGITVYNYKINYNMTYAQFQSELKKGTKIAMESTGIIEDTPVIEQPKEEDNATNSEQPKEEDNVTNSEQPKEDNTANSEQPKEDNTANSEQPKEDDNTVNSEQPAEEDNTVTKSDKELFREELIRRIETGDATAIDLTKYQLGKSDTYMIWKDVIGTDCRFYANANNIVPLEQNNKFIVYGIDADYGPRNKRALKVLNQLLEETDGMTDLEKVLYVHDYIVQKTTYNSKQTLTGYGSRVLGDNLGKCDGITRAMISVLTEMGIECYYESSDPMNHAWNYVKIDGELYHIDACWDITRQNKSTGANYHRFLLRNDTEMNVINPSHYQFYCYNHPDYISTSKRFEKWFVHDVAGRMYYNKGLWYYYDKTTNSIISSDIQGNGKKTIVEGGDTVIKLIDVNQGKLSYQKGDTKYTIIL